MSDTTIGHTNHDEETATENLREFVENTADADDLARLVSLVLDGDIVTVTMNNGATSQPFHDGHLLTAGWRIVMVGEKGIEGARQRHGESGGSSRSPPQILRRLASRPP